MTGWRAWWDSLTPDSKNFISNTASGVAVIFIGGILYLFRRSIGALGRRVFAVEAPTLPPIVIEVNTPPAPPLIEAPKTTKALAPTISSQIPRPPFVGFVARRDVEGRDIVEDLKEELAPGRNQLVTLSGAGGVGKTTLAAEAARALDERFAGRIVWSDAYSRSGYGLSTLLDDVATQLGQPEIRTLPPSAKEEAVRVLVSAPSSLIVLDNYETITPDEKLRIKAWFETAQCAVLITSRPKIEKTCNITIAAMNRDEAQEFLQKLIAQTQAAQMFSAEIRERIYETAEANPFLMEWIVAQIDAAQEPRTVLEELAQGEGEAAQRVFDRSFNLPQLGDDGRATLLALSLFVPSASRLALAEVAGFGNDDRRVNEAIKNLYALWLIKGVDENRRFTIEGLTRSLTKSRLSKEVYADEFRQRFVVHFLRYAEAHAKTTPEDFAALEAEKDNILSAMDVAFSLEDWLSVIRLMDAMNLDGVNGLLMMHGYWDEAIRCGKQALKAAQNLRNEAAIAHFAHNTAITFQQRGELDEARRLYGESLEIAKRLGNQKGIAISLHELGRFAQAQGEPEEARRLYGESLEIAKRLGDQSGIASTLHELGRFAQAQGEPEEARRLYGESLDIKKRLGDQSGIASTLGQLGLLAQDQGESEEARRLFNESLEIAKRLGDQSTIATTLHQLAMLAQDRGDLEEARRLYGESLDIAKRLGGQSSIASTLHQLATLAQARGDLEEARRLYGESLEIAKRLGNQISIANSLHNLAVIAQDQGGLEEARQLYDESLDIAKRLGDQSGIAITLGQLGSLAAKEGDKVEAERLMRESLSIFERLKSPNAEIVRQMLTELKGESS
jgi:tetratricopeptide (TPR) repeat protein